jgi:RNA recognition motif-containing protein
MEVKLYVGNLDYTTTEDDLRTLFAQAGTLASVALIKDRDTGRSKGFAFVEMGTQAEAQKAISMFNAFKLGDRELTVNLAKPREERSSGGFGNRGGAFGNPGSGANKGHARRGGNRRY